MFRIYGSSSSSCSCSLYDRTTDTFMGSSITPEPGSGYRVEKGPLVAVVRGLRESTIAVTHTIKQRRIFSRGTESSTSATSFCSLEAIAVHSPPYIYQLGRLNRCAPLIARCIVSSVRIPFAVAQRTIRAPRFQVLWLLCTQTSP